MHFENGQVLSWNFHFGGQLSIVCPVRVVEHSSAGLLVWLAKGSPTWRVALPDGVHLRDISPEDRPANGFPVRPDQWRLGNALIHLPPAADHATWWLYSPAMEFTGWYVNLQYHSLRGTDIEVIDLELDIEIALDRSFVWKDEESFEAKIGRSGYWTRAEAEGIRAEGTVMIETARAGRFPFDGSWCDFTPDPSWSPPPRPAKPSVRQPVGVPAGKCEHAAGGPSD